MTKAYRTDRLCDDDTDPADIHEAVADPDFDDVEFDDDGDLAEMNEFTDDSLDWPEDDDEEDTEPIETDEFA